tara:strand:+ start:1305 stop:6764 length:5460 start_codon:yes stop_codon:yes gene_type:complete
MNKIPVYLCIAILLGQVLLFSGEENAFHSTLDSEFDNEESFMTQGRYDPEEAVWQIETIDQSSSSSYGEFMGKYNKLQIDSYGKPHLTYLSPTGNAMNINYTFFNGQAWNTDTIAQSGGSPCFDLDSSDIPRVGLYTYSSSNTADIKLATPPAQSSSPWSLEMIDNSSANMGSNCDMVIGQDGDIYMIYWEFHTNNSALHFAHHNGNSWTKSVLDNDGGGFSSLEMDDDGDLHVVYQDIANGGLKYGINEGQGWTLSSLDASASGRGNSLDFDSDNNPHVSYFDLSNNSVKYAQLVSTGWSISTVKSGLSWTDNSTYYSETSIAIDSFDDVHITYYDTGLQHAFHGDNSWEFKEIDSVVNIQGTLEIVIDGNDKIHISYHDKDNESLKYATSQDSQDIWDLSIVDSQADVGEYSSIVLDSNDDTHISYFDASTKDLKYATDVSGQWATYTIDSEGDVGYGSSIAIDSNNALHISYDDSTNGDLKYATNVNGTWEISTIESQGNVGAYSSIGVDSYEKVHISYYDATNGDLRYATNQYQNSQWSLASVATSGNVGHHTSLVIDSDNTVHISYIDYDDEALHYAKNTWGPSGWVTSVIDSDSHSIGSSTSIAVDDSNKVHISYQDVTNKNLKYATDESGSWTTATVDALGDVGDTSSITTDSEGFVHISYFDDTNENLKHATNYNSTQTPPTWMIMTVDSSGAVGEYSSIAFDSEDRAHISYHDSTNSDLKYATSEGPQDGEGITDPANATVWFDNVGYASYAPDEISISFEIYTDCECSLKAWAYLDVYLNGTKIDTPFGTDYTVSDDSSVSKTVVWTAPNTGVYDFYLALFTGEQGPSTKVDDAWIQSISLTGSDWQTSTLDSNGDLGVHTSMAVDSTGDLHIVYYDGTNEEIKYATDESGSWVYSSIDIVGTATGTSIAVNSNNAVSIAYYEGTNGYLKYATQVEGSWALTTLDSSGDAGAYPSLAFDSNDNAHISYWDSTNFDLMYVTDVSGSWVIDTLDSSDDVGAWSSIGIDSADKVHISYYDSTNLNLKYATDTSGSWDYSVVDISGSAGSYSSLIIDSSDDIHISYYDGMVGNLLYANDETGSWTTTIVDSVGDVGLHSSIALDSNDDVHISYYDYASNYDLKYATQSSGSWDRKVIDSDANVGGFTSMVISSDDDIFIAYRDVTNQDLKIASNLNFISNQANETVESVIGWYEQWNESVNTILSMNSTAYNLEEDRNYLIQTLLYYSSNNTEIYTENFNFSGADWINYVTPTTGFSLSSDEITRGVEYCFISKLFYSSNLLSTADSCLTIPQLQDNNDNESEGDDFDGDGVPDEDDDCYDGRTDWSSTTASDYDSDGCQDSTEDWDDDNDGIDDQEDMCPTGSLGWYAFDASNPDNDYDGCQDSDEDLDDDDDGYLDTEDTCPVSRRGAVVDETGCETSFPDEDGDGVADDYDHCEDTDLDQEVDWHGCDIWEDQDNDGVHDNEDECEDTPEGSTVDDKGCVEENGNGSDGNSTDNSSNTGNQTGDGNETVVDDDPIEEDEDEIVDLLAEDWYEEIPILGSLIEQAQTKYGQYAGISVLSVTILGYVYRGLTMRSEYKMSKRVKKFKKQISKAGSAKALRHIQTEIEEADGRRLLPQGALGDLLSLIELRAEDLGLTDFITQDSLIEAGITRDELLDGVDALNQAREDLANAQFESENSRGRGPPGLSRSASIPPKQVATATLKGAGKGGGVKRPSYHPKDLNRDGSVDEEDEEIWANMSQSERDAKRNQSARSQTNIAAQVVAFSKLPPNLKSRCHCGKKKAYGKCCFKTDMCPCGNGKKFYKCCAKERGY